MQHHTSYPGEESLVVASQQGNLHACQEIVSQHQGELRRTAYLLTGGLQAADVLAREAFLAFFHELLQDEPDHDIRPRLLQALAVCYLDAERDFAAEAAHPESFAEPGSQRFNVDDDRSRLRMALDRLERPDRLALILRDFNGQPVEWIASVLDTIPHNVQTRVDPAHRRVREMVGVPAEEPLYGMLARFAFDVPRTDLWSEIEEPLRQLFDRERLRRRLITFSILGVAGLVLVAGLVWLFGGQIWEDDDAEMAGEATPADAQFQAVGTPAPPATTATAQPTPTATPQVLPAASVPDLHLMTAYGDLFSNSDRSQYVYDPGMNSVEPLVESSGFPSISPDGQWMVYGRFTPVNFDHPTAISVLDSQSQELVWETGSSPIYEMAVSSDRLYVLTEGDEGRGSWEIQVRDLMTGESISAAGMDGLDAPEVNRIIAEENARLFIAPDESHLYVAADAPDHSAGQWTRVLISYALPAMERTAVHSHTIQWQDGQFDSDFDFRRAWPAPDGSGLYAVMHPSRESAGRVQFLDADDGEMTSLSIPFTPASGPARRAQAEQPQRLIPIPGNDGKKLYVIASVRGEVAIVDLLERRVERVFSLDPGDYADVLTLGRLGRGAFAAPVTTLSPDGSRLYVGNIWEGENGPASAQNQFSVWVIDTTVWRVVDRWQVPGYISAILPGASGQSVHVRSTVLQGNIVAGNSLTTFDAASGEATQEHNGLPVPDWASGFWLASPASLYRQEYGWAPGVAEQGQPGDSALESTLPAIEMRTGEGPVQPGGEARIAVRFADPATGETVREAQPDVRFSPDASVTIRLSHVDGAGDEAVIVPQINQEGFYRGTAVLSEPGWWTAQIIVSNPDGSSWRTPPRRAVQVSGEIASAVDAGMICPVPIDASCRPAEGTD